MRPRDAALVGACQSVSAILHGFSRSGNTISVGLFAGLSRRAAAEFSFLLSIPTILAAAAVENLHAYRHQDGSARGRKLSSRRTPSACSWRPSSAISRSPRFSGSSSRCACGRSSSYCAVLGLVLVLLGERISSGFAGELKVLSCGDRAQDRASSVGVSCGGATSFSESSSSPRASFCSRRSSRITRTTPRSSRP